MIENTIEPVFTGAGVTEDGETYSTFVYKGYETCTCDMCQKTQTIYPTDEEYKMFPNELKPLLTYARNDHPRAIDVVALRFQPCDERMFPYENVKYAVHSSSMGFCEVTLQICIECLEKIRWNKDSDRFKRIMTLL